MPRPAKGARLWLRPARYDKSGTLTHIAQWIILDGGKQHPTGCSAGALEEAQGVLADYIRDRHKPQRKEKDIEAINLADVLSIYDADCRDRQANKRTFDAMMERLTLWWGGKNLSDVTGETCRSYVEARKAAYRERHRATAKKAPLKDNGGQGGARRDLETLRAAIVHHAKEGLHRGIVRVALPRSGVAKDRWLTRQEAARLLWVCWRTKQTQRPPRGPNKGKLIESAGHPLRHLARFILIGLYTGTRAAAIASASPRRGDGRSYVDLERGLFYRLAEGKRASNKRQPPVPLPPHLLSHMRRWVDLGIAKDYFVEWRGKPVGSVSKAFISASQKAGLDGKVTPHTLRHTAATWLMQNGADIWSAAGFLGMSPELVEKTYGHHHPDYLQAVSRKFRKSSTANVSPTKPQKKAG